MQAEGSLAGKLPGAVFIMVSRLATVRRAWGGGRDFALLTPKRTIRKRAGLALNFLRCAPRDGGGQIKALRASQIRVCV